MFPQLVLLAYIFVSVALFALTKPRRAFLLTYLIGYLLLPVEVGDQVGWQGAVVLTQSLRIDKLTACNLGALLGTLLFAPKAFSRLRFHWVDAAYGVVLVGMFLTSFANGLGAKDGLSHGIEEIRQFAPLLLLARVYLRTPDDLLDAARSLIAAAFLYTFICLAEWRLSPQTHRLVYGYFQHSFEQFARYGFFRPVGFLHHAIELAFFMGSAAALAGWLTYKKLMRPLWGMVPPGMVCAALVLGLITTMTFSGVGAFLAIVGCLSLLVLFRSRWLLILLPACAIFWMVGRYTNTIDASFLLRTASLIDSSRSESLEYRLESERLHLAAASQNLLLGKGSLNAMVRDVDGKVVKAVDAWWLITLVFYGLVGITGWYIVWMGGILDTLRRWRTLDPAFRALAAGICMLIGAQFIDFLFNSFPSPFLFMLNIGLIGTLQAYRPQPAVFYMPTYDYIPEEDPLNVPVREVPAT